MKENDDIKIEPALQQAVELTRLKAVAGQSPYEHLLHPMRILAMLLIPGVLFVLNRILVDQALWPIVVLSPLFVLIAVEGMRRRSIKKAKKRLSELESVT